MRRTVRAFWDAYWSFVDDDGWAISSHLALSALTSLFPFLIFLTALASSFGSQDLSDQVASLLLDTWPERVAAPIAAEIHNVLTQSHSGLATIGAVLALYFSSSGIEAVRTGLNRAYGVKERRSWWLLRLESIAYVLVGAVALLLLAFLVVLGPLLWDTAVGYVPALAWADQFVTFARLWVSATVLTVALIIAHKFLPAEQRSFAQIAPGVVFTLAFSLIFAMAFGSYLARFARNYVSTYAGLASVMIAMIFLYTLSTFLVFGGELNAAIGRLRARDAAAKAADESKGPRADGSEPPALVPFPTKAR